MHNFCSFVSSLRLYSPKTLGKDPLLSDQDEEMHSASETESEGGSEEEGKNDAPSTNEGTVVSLSSDILPEGVSQDNSQPMGDNNFNPTAIELVEKDMDPVEREVLVHEPSTQVTSYFLI